MLERVRAFFAQGTRAHSVVEHYSWFRAGYETALDDIERTGLHPRTSRTRKECVDRALERWVDTGDVSLPSHETPERS